jgi:hypothetical protein
MSNTTDAPAPLFTQHLQPLRDRLDDADALALAMAIDETPEVLADPRLQDALLAAIFGPGGRLLMAWPDGSLGFVWFAPRRPIGPALVEAYQAARSALEAIHLQSAPAVGVHH